MKYYTDENGIWAKKILDPQIICFKPEIEAALQNEPWLFKIELSNSGLRYILTMVGGPDDCHWACTPDDKGWFVKTLKMDLLESIQFAKRIIGPGRPILVDDIMFNKEPTAEWKAFNRWFNSISSGAPKREIKQNHVAIRNIMLENET